MIARRSFLTGLASLIAAPAIVHAGNLMPVRALAPAISMRVITDYVRDQSINRLEVLYGRMLIRPEWARIQMFSDSIALMNS